MKKQQARKTIVNALTDAISRRLAAIAQDDGHCENARLRITGWSSPRLYRLAAEAAVTVLEAGREGERLGKTHGNA